MLSLKRAPESISADHARMYSSYGCNPFLRFSVALFVLLSSLFSFEVMTVTSFFFVLETLTLFPFVLCFLQSFAVSDDLLRMRF
jgi:hypothetical protein